MEYNDYHLGKLPDNPPGPISLEELEWLHYKWSFIGTPLSEKLYSMARFGGIAPSTITIPDHPERVI